MPSWRRPLTRSPLPSFVPALLAAALIAASCGGGSDLVIGATTSVRDTGLLDALLEAFSQESGYDARPIVAGSGQVLELARRGEVDAVITHSPEEEAQLVADGDGIDRRGAMHNFFVLVGPPDDPAGVAAAATVVEALGRIAARGATFISRGDMSGTHVRELSLWRRAGIYPSGQPWYQESGSGQGQNLMVASDKGAYTLVDDSTFLVFEEPLALEEFVRDDEPNRYSVIRVSPQKHDVNEAAALAFADFLTSPAAQQIIAQFGREEYGEPLFTPDAADRTATPTPVSTP